MGYSKKMWGVTALLVVSILTTTAATAFAAQKNSEETVTETTTEYKEDIRTEEYQSDSTVEKKSSAEIKIPTYKNPMKIDGTLAVPPVFMTSNYAALNPQTAIACNGDIQLMYNYYMHKGVRDGQRIFATPLPTPIERLFLYMSYYRDYYIENGTNADFPYFNVAKYMEDNPLLTMLLDEDNKMYVYHYVNFGIYEGLSCGTDNDPAKIITWNYTIAEFNNPTLKPKKILSNFKAITKYLTTAGLNPVFDDNGNLKKTVDTAAKPSTNSSTSSSSSAYCSHEYEYVSLDGEGKHEKKCKKCGYVDFTDDHNYEVHSQTYKDDENYHELKCKDCRHKHKEKHIDRNHDGVCDVCGYKSPHIHDFKIVSSYDETKHKVKCQLCDDEGYEPHSFKLQPLSSATAEGHQYKCDCGYIKTEPHKYVDEVCSVCGYHLPDHAHTFKYTQNDNNTHSGMCTYPNCTKTDNGNCDHNGADGSCSKCGRPCSHNYEYTPNSDGKTHKGVCKECSKEITEDCDHSGSEGKCSKCGRGCSHKYGSFEIDTENPGKHKKVCEYCNDVIREDCDTNGTDGECSVCGYKASI